MANIGGLNQLDKALQDILNNNPKAEKRGLKKGAEYLQSQLSQNAPYEPRRSAHLRDDVQVSSVKNEHGYQYVEVGWGKDTSWRVHFTEFGTIKDPPNAFIESTERDARQNIYKLIQDEIKRVINL